MAGEAGGGGIAQRESQAESGGNAKVPCRAELNADDRRRADEREHRCRPPRPARGPERGSDATGRQQQSGPAEDERCGGGDQGRRACCPASLSRSSKSPPKASPGRGTSASARGARRPSTRKANPASLKRAASALSSQISPRTAECPPTRKYGVAADQQELAICDILRIRPERLGAGEHQEAGRNDRAAPKSCRALARDAATACRSAALGGGHRGGDELGSGANIGVDEAEPVALGQPARRASRHEACRPSLPAGGPRRQASPGDRGPPDRCDHRPPCRPAIRHRRR